MPMLPNSAARLQRDCGRFGHRRQAAQAQSRRGSRGAEVHFPDVVVALVDGSAAVSIGAIVGGHGGPERVPPHRVVCGVHETVPVVVAFHPQMRFDPDVVQRELVRVGDDLVLHDSPIEGRTRCVRAIPPPPVERVRGERRFARADLSSPGPGGRIGVDLEVIRGARHDGHAAVNKSLSAECVRTGIAIQEPPVAGHRVDRTTRRVGIRCDDPTAIVVG